MAIIQSSGIIPQRIQKYYAFNEDGMYIATLFLEPSDVAHQVNITPVEPEFEEGSLPWFDGKAWTNKKIELPPPPEEA